MEKYNSYWPIYKNLEDETINLTKYIQFSDDQLKVYSMYISDLIMKIVVEIEDLSKKIYMLNGGKDVFDENGNKRDLYFDTDCINYLNSIWGICDRYIMVSCSHFNFTNEENKLLRPLKNANKNGDKSSKWNKAYQAVKHDRRENIKKGNLKNLIEALGALYILNLYYRDDKIENFKEERFDNRFGSDIFSASYVDVSKTSFNINGDDSTIDMNEKKKIPNSVFIIKYNDESWENIHLELKKYNDEMIKSINSNPILIKKIEEEISKSKNKVNVKSIYEKCFIEMRNEYVSKKPPTFFGNMVIRAKKDVILNKGQAVIYKIENK